VDQAQQGLQARPTFAQATVEHIHLGLNQASAGLWDQIRPLWEAGSIWDYVQKTRSRDWVHDFACRLHPSHESLAAQVYTASDDYKRLVHTLVDRPKSRGGYDGKWEGLFHDHAVKDTCFDDQRPVLGPDNLARLLKAAGYHGGLSMVEANKILKLPNGTIGVMDYDHFCKTFKDS
jgi:hypothetical protein